MRLNVGVVSGSGSGPGTPGVPRNVTATPVGGGSVYVDWDAPISDGGSPIDKYQVDYSDDGGSTWTPAGLGAPETDRTVPSLTIGDTYLFRVEAGNALGYGPYAYSSPTLVTSSPSATSASGSDSTVTPTVTTSSATTQTFSTLSTVQAYTSTSTWTNPFPAGATTGTATITGSTSVGTLDYVFGTTDGGPYGSTSSSGSLTGLIRNTTYYTRARGTNSSCAMSLSGTVNARGLSTTVVFEYGTSSGSYPNSVTATQSPVTGFSNTAVSASVSSLSAGTYFFRIRATNSLGTTFSPEASVTISAKTAFGVQRSFTPPAVTIIYGLTIVAGGGGGASEGGGGGGGAGNFWASVSVGSSVAVTVGGGGAFGVSGASGGASSFGSQASNGGGGAPVPDSLDDEADGGASGNGNPGGDGSYSIFGDYTGGGGGGAGGAGGNFSGVNGGNGGASSTVDGYGYGGGGGGGSNLGSGGTGGTYGGNGWPNASRDGTASRGGGGGGLGNGGSGYVRFYYYGP
jgi:hypothetical protein